MSRDDPCPQIAPRKVPVGRENKGLVPLDGSCGGAYVPLHRIEGDLESGKKRLRFLRIATHPGARFPGEWQESPERVEASAETFSGFLRVRAVVRRIRVNRRETAGERIAKTDRPFAKNKHCFNLSEGCRWSTFPATSPGRPGGGGPSGGKPPNGSDRTAGRPARRSPRRQTGNQAATGGPSAKGDPSGSSSEHGPRQTSVCRRQVERPAGRLSGVAIAEGFGSLRNLNGVGSPARPRTGNESPERVAVSAKTPSGFSRVWMVSGRHSGAG